MVAVLRLQVMLHAVHKPLQRVAEHRLAVRRLRGHKLLLELAEKVGAGEEKGQERPGHRPLVGAILGDNLRMGFMWCMWCVW